jgi:hypothetical protein
MNVTRAKSGFEALPPGPANRSREAMSAGSRHKTAVPVGVSFFFLDFFSTASADEEEMTRAMMHTKAINAPNLRGRNMRRKYLSGK